jgi:flagellar biosynthesis protein FliQ
MIGVIVAMLIALPWMLHTMLTYTRALISGLGSYT